MMIFNTTNHVGITRNASRQAAQLSPSSATSHLPLGNDSPLQDWPSPPSTSTTFWNSSMDPLAVASDLLLDDMLFGDFNDDDEPVRQWGGSPKGRRPNKNRDFFGAYQRIKRMYFSGPVSTYDEQDFERRYRMPREVFTTIYNAVHGKGSFLWKRNALGDLQIHPLVRVTACMRVLGYGSAGDKEDENLEMGEMTILNAVKEFSAIVVDKFSREYLRPPNMREKKRLLRLNAKRNFPGMVASWDCSHFVWKNCPIIYQGQHRNRKAALTCAWYCMRRVESRLNRVSMESGDFHQRKVAAAQHQQQHAQAAVEDDASEDAAVHASGGNAAPATSFTTGTSSRLSRRTKKSTLILVRIAQRMERIHISKRRIPVRCRRLLHSVDQSSSGGGGEQTTPSAPTESSSSSSIPLISGLSQVVSGAAPASATVRICNVRPPRYLFYATSGFVCDIVQLFIDLAIHLLLGVGDPSKCWAVGFALSIIVRHSAHRYMTFGAYVGGYWKSLGRMYAGYSISIGLSTAFNYLITEMLSFSHYLAFGATLLWTGIVNYFILKRLWSFGGDNDDAKGKFAGGSAPVIEKLDSTV